VRGFDRKFGADFVRELPAAPAVYLFVDGRGRVIYAGKAKNIRQRLQRYRSAGRRKAQRKMRAVVREASTLEVRLQPSEAQALLVENELIRTLRPRYNVEGAYSFLYPAIGVAERGPQLLLGFSTRTGAWEELGLDWFGVFRSRAWVRDAFDALLDLLARIGHGEPGNHLPRVRRPRGSRLVGLRRLGAELPASLRAFLAGRSPRLLEQLSLLLLEKPDARRESARVQEDLRRLEAFYREDAAPLREALRRAGRPGHFVTQAERDALFIAARLRR
jgi:hypothetical protein